MHLQNCPHCGSEAKLKHHAGSPRKYPAYVILCSNVECLACMSACYNVLDPALDLERTKQRLVNCWNNRTQGVNNAVSNDSVAEPV